MNNWIDNIKEGMRLITENCHEAQTTITLAPCMTKCPFRDMCYHLITSTNDTTLRPWNWDKKGD